MKDGGRIFLFLKQIFFNKIIYFYPAYVFMFVCPHQNKVWVSPSCIGDTLFSTQQPCEVGLRVSSGLKSLVCLSACLSSFKVLTFQLGTQTWIIWSNGEIKCLTKFKQELFSCTLHIMQHVFLVIFNIYKQQYSGEFVTKEYVFLFFAFLMVDWF